MFELEDYMTNMNQHYMFHTNAALVRTLDATEEEKEKYHEHLD